MYVYHGSNHSFRVLRIRKDLTKESSLKNEGYGVYFALSRSVASSYGKFLYTIEISDGYLTDMRRLDTCKAYIRRISGNVYKRFGFHLEAYINMPMLAEYIRCGNVSIADIGRELQNLLDSNELFYRHHGNHSEEIFKWLVFREHYPSVYLFTSEIEGNGVIKRVTPEVARLVSKERVK